MQIIRREVHGYNHAEMPEENETIADSLDIEVLLPIIHSVSYYLRSPQDCPLARGNWILDIEAKDGQLYCFKYPKEMSEGRFVEFLQPLLSRLKRGAH